jgi:hypothetical protein
LALKGPGIKGQTNRYINYLFFNTNVFLVIEHRKLYLVMRVDQNSFFDPAPLFEKVARTEGIQQILPGAKKEPPVANCNT